MQLAKAAMLLTVVQRLVKLLKTVSQVKPQTTPGLNSCHRLVTPTTKRVHWDWQEQCLQPVLAWALALRRSVMKIK
ncbi:hypothetical protein FC47_GL001448 [Limosilactobacillus mucosae DSM 13345]|uniref:Uncharacterized protein n=1 Tax=Limosilactobacillus mucosae DSM 13345 TaxID=1423771 RepID=A0A0R1NSK0_LIMMU|nr:hypothetical protein FC47_GL001448 [Limosilactobacillus mucosae DSM 13345]